MSDEQSGKVGYKLLATLSSVLGAYLARKVLAFSWQRATGGEPPANPEHPSVTWPEALAWAVVSGAVMGVARMAAQRQVAQSWQKATGALPPGLEESAA